MAPLAYREVTGYFTARIPDSGDSDEYPDTIPLTGAVTFTPEYRKPLVFPGEHVVLEPIHARIVDGYLMGEVMDGEETVLQSLHLPVTMDERANQAWSWRLSFSNVTLGDYGETVDLRDMRFPIEPGDGPLDLSEVAGEWKGGGLITRGAPGPGITSITAQDGELVITWDGGDDVAIDVPDAVPGEPGEDGAPGPRGERGPRGIQGIQGPAGAGSGVPIAGQIPSGTNIITIFEDGFYRSQSASDVVEANGWPAFFPAGANATLVVARNGTVATQFAMSTSSAAPTAAYRSINTSNVTASPWQPMTPGAFPLATSTAPGLQPAGRVVELDTTVGTKVTIGGQVVHYDSGERIIPLKAGVSGTAYLSRNNSVVDLYIRDVSLPDRQSDILDIPQGFRPRRVPRYGMTGRTGSRQFAAFDVSASSILVQSTSHTATLYANFSWPTRDAIPTTLPGTPG